MNKLTKTSADTSFVFTALVLAALSASPAAVRRRPQCVAGRSACCGYCEQYV